LVRTIVPAVSPLCNWKSTKTEMSGMSVTLWDSKINMFDFYP
jgi:hypothetical protein